MIAHPRDLLKEYTRLESFRILIASIDGEDEISDQIRVEYALFVAGLHRSSRANLPVLRPQEGSAPFDNLTDYVPALLEVSRQSPFQKIRAMAINALPNLEAVGTAYGAPETLPDIAARAIYLAKLNEHALFTETLMELRKQAESFRTSYFMIIPPLTLTYLVDKQGPCIAIGPGGPDDGQRLPMTHQELFESLRVLAELPSDEQAQRFQAIIGSLRERKPY
jgi:hypothetical protein